MKRLFALLLALAMIFSLGVTAFASEIDENPAQDPVTPPAGDGSITVTNPTIGQTYRLFKIFDATYATTTNDNNETIVLIGADGKAVVSYSITPDNKFFEAMFGADGKGSNNYFVYDSVTGVVTKRDNAVDSEIIEYLSKLIENPAIQPIDEATLDANATEDTIVFDDLAPGYYLVDRGVNSTVTITTNMPHVEIIDKNQTPNSEDSFKKEIYDEDVHSWGSSASSTVGDIVDFKITFKATNYDGDKKIKYYAVRDQKDSALWIEFNSIKVSVDGVDLGPGYYYCAGDPSLDTGDWTSEKNSEQWADSPANAGWYLIHYNYDDIEIVIPWLENSTIVNPGENSGNQNVHQVTTVGDAEHKFDPNTTVVVEYTASVGPQAIDSTEVQNSASLKWVYEGETGDEPDGPGTPEVTTTTAYNMGIYKVDGTDNKPLAGAVFELYADSACTQRINLIPIAKNAEGEYTVYVVDDAMTNISGANRKTTREFYNTSEVNHWEEYLLADPNPEAAADASDADKIAQNCRNDVTTPGNGKLVIKGLEANTYFLKETKAPDGYNKLANPAVVIVGSGTNYDESEKFGTNVYYVEVANNRGAELPATGGEGRMMLISIGSMVAIGFAILMITQKKMSAYND